MQKLIEAELTHRGKAIPYQALHHFDYFFALSNFSLCNYENAISNICSYQKINDPMEILKIVYKYYLILLSFISAFGFMTGLLYFISNCCKYMYNNFCCRKKQKTPDFSFLNKKNRPKYNSIT